MCGMCKLQALRIFCCSFDLHFRELCTLPAILQSLAKSEILPGDERAILEVRRSHVLKDGLKEARKGKFNPKKRLKVCDLDGLLCTMMHHGYIGSLCW